jgi:replication initiation protein RepC
MPIDPRPMNWNDFIEASYKLKADLHISQQAWANACTVLGRTGASICVLLTDHATQRADDPVLKPAGYFNAMINRAINGELKLHNSIFGILKREGEIS